MLKTIKDIDPKDQKVLCRVDYNVPMKNGKIIDDTRIVSSLQTISYILERGGLIILISHLGRPKGYDEKLSLKPIADHLSNLLNRSVMFCPELVGERAQSLIEGMSKESYQVVMLENTRFEKGETKNDLELAKSLASFADIFVSDAFGTAHRAHASTEGVTKFIPGYAGYLIEKEYNQILSAISKPQKPLLAIIGGVKVSTKLSVIKNLLKTVDDMIIGGGMAYTFIKAQGGSIGNSLVEDDMIDDAKSLLNLANDNQVQIHLPKDIRLALDFDTPLIENDAVKIINSYQIPEDAMGLDIGPESEIQFIDVINRANTIIWNGPMGVFESVLFRSGTNSIAKSVFKRGVNTIIGGGDTIYAINVADIVSIPNNIHISTGGGASLELMSGKELPGISCLIGKSL
ncbi:MAG: phosphoglycerate kinase [Candidatus Kariarchaeaceae archaeon]